MTRFVAMPAARPATILALVAIVLFGALLRLDALTVKYGGLDQPAWAVRLERTLLPVSRALRPAAVPWGHVEKPYVGGDPINYLRFSREMRHFYQAHVREPLFLALTRLMLWLTRGRDIAVSFASALAGTMAIVATFLLGAAACSRAAGLVAAAALAIELEAVTWSVDGWRDDTFMLFVALCGWAFVRLMQRPTPAMGVMAGVVAAAACLTRITALSFVLPALMWIAIRRSTDGSSQLPSSSPGWSSHLWGPRGNFQLPTASAQMWMPRGGAARAAGIAAGVVAILVLPFLINCWRATGDPFFAINYHTRYYRAAEGLPLDESVGALDYVTQKLRERPIATADTVGVGLLVFPFANKWSGFTPWSRALGSALRRLALVGLVLALWSPEGRLLWLVLITSLAPYAVTWPLGGGSEWRFTQHAYPFYLVAAGSSLVLLLRWTRSLVNRQTGWRALFTRRRATQATACALVIAAGWAVYTALPYLVVREALAAGETVSIAVGDRDFPFFSSKWSPPNGSGNVIVRVAVADRVSLRLPLPRAVDYTLTLRMDAPEMADPVYQPKVTVFLDNHTVAQVRFRNDPTRVGAYRVPIPRDFAGRLFSRLDLVASHTVRAADAGPRFAWLAPDTPVAFYLWYVRVEPRPSEQGSRVLGF